MKKDPIATRRRQIENQVTMIYVQIGKKTQRDFKTPEAYFAWKERQTDKLEALHGELAILEYPEGYHEVPLAIAAAELGISLSDMCYLVRQQLVDISSAGESFEGQRITRDELGSLIDCGAENLLEIAGQTPQQIFHAALQNVRTGDVDLLKKANDRIDRNDSCINPFALALEIAIHFIQGNLAEIESSLDFISRRDVEDLATVLIALKAVVEKLEGESHPLRVLKERILVTADGIKEAPFRNTYSRYAGSTRRSQMNENQKRALFLRDVVVESLEKYKFIKSLESTRGFSAVRKEEIEVLIADAVYTALEAERLYQESATGRLYVDRFVDLSPKWSKAPQTFIAFQRLPEE